jgi:hypothetical protein
MQASTEPESTDPCNALWGIVLVLGEIAARVQRRSDEDQTASRVEPAEPIQEAA